MVCFSSEKLIVQISKKFFEIYEEYKNFGPTFCSKNSVVGEEDCRRFFPPDYDVPEESEQVVETKKKRRRARKEKPAIPSQETALENIAVSEVEAVEEEELNDAEMVEKESLVDEDEENEEAGSSIGADKATSPMASPIIEASDSVQGK